MIRIAILDDDKSQQQNTKKLVEEYFNDLGKEHYELRIFSTATKLINYIYEHGSFDIYLLDVVMPEINGIEVGKQLRSMGEKGFVVYLSLESAYSLDAFSVHAYHYLIKPIQKEQFTRLMDDLCKQAKVISKKHVFVKTTESVEQINLDQINYVELIKRRATYFLVDDTNVISTTLHQTFENAMQELLKDHRFTMCGASYVVNLHQISSIRDMQIIFKNGQQIKPPKKYIATIKSQWLEYWLNDS